MKIGIYDPYLDDLGGGEKYMLTIAEALSRKHIVDVFWDNGDDIDRLTKRFPLNLSKVNRVANIFSSKVSFANRLKESLKYDRIILLSDGSLPLLLSKKTFIHFQQPFPSIKPNFVNKLKLKKINDVFCNSKFTKHFIDTEFGIKSKILYPPVDFYSKKINKENIILSVGRFRVKDLTTTKSGKNEKIGDFKKQSVMVDIFKDMIDSGLTGWKFILATSVNDSEKETFEIFKKSAIGYPIEFLVNKSNKDLWEIYSKSKIYWHASGFGEDLNTHPELAEHFGISTVEAMGAGCVPVVINAGGQKEIVEEEINGFLWNTKEELISKTLNLINDTSLLSKISGNAISSVGKFDKKHFEEQIIELIS